MRWNYKKLHVQCQQKIRLTLSNKLIFEPAVTGFNLYSNIRTINQIPIALYASNQINEIMHNSCNSINFYGMSKYKFTKNYKLKIELFTSFKKYFEL